MIFIGIFFGIFYKQVAREFQEANKCKIEEIKIADLDGSEKYGALGIRFTDSNGKELLGMGCISSKKYSGMGNSPYTYQDYEHGDSISCGLNRGIGIESVSNDELKSPYYKGSDNNDETRILYTGGSYGGGSYSGGSYSSSSYSSSSYSDSDYDSYDSGSTGCSYSQDWIQVKLPAWSQKKFQKI
ncbi:hypothetical protein PPERSA_04895 [Pseudocohnilembus persalinus]|uniref:Uncharacterized protein n=1 Tax=Pseudocohnilembus persalinus TaxID=266149 RepID=A0A0V0QIY8_PSEPJ|nr:hypothetical protein PPERSA_04895 [Pseudocohnilembus persalinus]|eukprot:KRX02273.1 hypothetical protein PPERSA_04895 [Pseudocohnilembus persalinus]